MPLASICGPLALVKGPLCSSRLKPVDVRVHNDDPPHSSLRSLLVPLERGTDVVGSRALGVRRKGRSSCPVRQTSSCQAARSVEEATIGS